MATAFKIGTMVNHAQYGKGEILSSEEFTYMIKFKSRGAVEVSKRFEGLTEVIEESEGLMMSDVKRLLKDILEDYGVIQEDVALGSKWYGGIVMIKPGNPQLQPKEIPIDQLFKKIVMVRERLRVLEQNINNHPKLDEEDKIHLQQYITKAYGSLTTFNVLFKNDKDQFIGESKKRQ